MSLEGRLLVALPLLVDANFDRTVVLVLTHNDDGAVGVVLNRPSTTPVAEVLPRWSDLASDPAVVHVGGPVQPEVGIALGRGVNRVVTVDLDTDPVLAEVHEIRLFAGYAGWSAGQLEGEIDEGAWLVVDSLPLDAFSTESDDLWHEVLRRQPGTIAWMANLPDDISVN